MGRRDHWPIDVISPEVVEGRLGQDREGLLVQDQGVSEAAVTGVQTLPAPGPLTPEAVEVAVRAVAPGPAVPAS
jgi:hypothetical protein